MKELDIIGNVYKVRELEKTACMTVVESERKKMSDGSEKWQNTWVDVYIDKASMSEYNVGDLIKVKGDFFLSLYTKDGETRVAIKMYDAQIHKIIEKKTKEESTK